MRREEGLMESERRRRGRKAKAEKRSPDLEKGNQTVCKSKNKKQSGEKEDKPEPALLRGKKKFASTLSSSLLPVTLFSKLPRFVSVL